MLSMSVMTHARRSGFAVIERLLAALTDPARRERTAAALVLGYVALCATLLARPVGSDRCRGRNYLPHHH